MKLVDEIKVDEKEIAELERAFYEYYTIKDTLSFMIDTHVQEPEFIHSEVFKMYQEDAVKKCKEYELLRNNFAFRSIPEKYVDDDGKFFWEADFENKSIKIFER